MNRATLKAAAKASIKGKLGILFVIGLVIALVNTALATIPVVGTIASAILAGGFALATAKIYLGVSEGVKPEIKDAFAYVKQSLPGFFASFLMSLFVSLWTLLLVIPGFVKACAYSQTMYILAEDPSIGPMAAIKQSQEMMKGHKMEFFKLLLSFLGWALLAPFTLGLLYIWLLPYMQATFANYYKSLKGEFHAE